MPTHSDQRTKPATRVCQLLALLTVALANGVATAQGPAPAAPNIAQNISSGRSYYFEISLVVVLFGAALFAVCRSSFRR